MKAFDLFKISKLFFGYEEIAKILGVSETSAKVSAVRYSKLGLIKRIKRNTYVLREKWVNLSLEEKFSVSNLLQVPSYISLTTALIYYGISTQLQQDFFEAITLRRSFLCDLEPVSFNFTRINCSLYSGFIRRNNFFIAEPEKAFLDALYLKALGRYNFDISSMDLKKLSLENLQKWIEIFPEKIEKMVRVYGYL